MSVSIDIVYEGDLHCQATHVPSGRTLQTDAPVDNGGKGATFSPTDLVATALGSCLLTVMDLVAKRNNLDLRGTRLRVVKEMTTEPPRRISALTVRVELPAGTVVSEVDRVKLEKAAGYCPVKLSLHPDIKVTLEFVYA